MNYQTEELRQAADRLQASEFYWYNYVQNEFDPHDRHANRHGAALTEEKTQVKKKQLCTLATLHAPQECMVLIVFLHSYIRCRSEETCQQTEN